jgi:hypothetical protein
MSGEAAGTASTAAGGDGFDHLSFAGVSLYIDMNIAKITRRNAMRFTNLCMFMTLRSGVYCLLSCYSTIVK